MTNIFGNYVELGGHIRRDLEKLDRYHYGALSTISNYSLGILYEKALCQYKWLTPEIVNSLLSVWYKHDFDLDKLQSIIDGWEDTNSYIRSVHSKTIKRQYRKELYEEEFGQLSQHHRGLSNEHHAPRSK